MLDKPGWWQTPMVFISTLECAERILLYLTPQERQNLEDSFLILYDIKWCETERVFQEGVLRRGENGTAEMYAATQKQIQEIMHNPTDVASMILDNKDQLRVYILNKIFRTRC